MRIDKAIQLVQNHPTRDTSEKIWIMGYLSALDDYAIYQDGERYIGALHTPLEKK